MRVGLAAGLALLLGAAPALAAPSCALPATTPVPRPFGPSENDPARIMPITSYTLAISWSPQYCRTGQGMGGSFDKGLQCDRKANRFGLVLHGLWPDGKGSWPQYCRPARLLTAATVRAHLCATPSADLLQHEWAKHGTCMSKSPDAYFAAARKAYDQIRFPDMEALARRQDLTVGDLALAFAAANRAGPRGLTARSVKVALADDGSLVELRLCMDRRQRFTACAAGQAGGAPADRPVRIWLPQ